MKYQEIISQLTLEEKASLMAGKSVWESKDYPEKGVPSIFLSDGPHGIRKQEGEGDHLGLNASTPATCFPTAATLANSWNLDLLEEVGQALGAEASSLGVNMVLGPGLNIKRNPLCGRNFEYFSEDPYQAGKLAGAMIRGLQSQGVAATPKHFAVNSQELRRMASDSVLDERTLREIYLTGFEIAVKEGDPKAIMSAYNKINGIYANEDKRLLRDILRDEWGFRGIVVSDWGGSNDHVLGVENGSHLEMPGTVTVGQKEIIDAVSDSRLSEAVLDERVDEFLHVVLGLASQKQKSVNYDDQHAVARKAATDSLVLLKNEDNILPLQPEKSLAIIGEFAQNPRYQGAGSSLINTKKLENMVAAVDAYDLNVVGYAPGYKRVDQTDETLAQEALALAGKADTIIFYMGLDEISESEGLDRSHISLPKNQLALLEKLVAINPQIVVVMAAGSVVDMAWDKNVKAVLHGYLTGQAGATAILDALTGRINPSGKLSESYPLSLADIPSSKDFPAAGDYSLYREGPYVGYRYFDSAQVAVKYPFGYGLSYTTFTYDDLVIEEDGVRLTITNTGQRAGGEVVQLYVGKEASALYRPSKELKGFAKVYLEPGQTQQIFINFNEMTFRYFNIATGKFEVEAGTYRISVGASSRDLLLTGQIQKEGTTAILPDLSNLPSYFSADVKDVSDDEFAALLGRPVPLESWTVGQELRLNDPLSKMQYAKSALARLVFKILDSMLKKAEARGKPDLNLLFIYNMPFRAIAKMTGDRMDQKMVAGILTMVNGHFFKGFGQTWSAFRAKLKYQKQLS